VERRGEGGRIGILGGTFDPVHIAHLVAAVEARTALGLDRVLLVVANDPWQKSARVPVTAAEDRYAMTVAAVLGVEGVEASRLEIDRGGPSYSIDTVEHLATAWPDDELYLIVGTDVVGDLGTWHRVEDLKQLVTLVMVERAGVRATPHPAGWQVQQVAIPALDISSRDLRHRLATGGNVRFLIPDAAIRCIGDRGLYAESR